LGYVNIPASMSLPGSYSEGARDGFTPPKGRKNGSLAKIAAASERPHLAAAPHNAMLHHCVSARTLRIKPRRLTRFNRFNNTSNWSSVSLFKTSI